MENNSEDEEERREERQMDGGRRQKVRASIINHHHRCVFRFCWCDDDDETKREVVGFVKACLFALCFLFFSLTSRTRSFLNVSCFSHRAEALRTRTLSTTRSNTLETTGTKLCERAKEKEANLKNPSKAGSSSSPASTKKRKRKTCTKTLAISGRFQTCT